MKTMNARALTKTDTMMPTTKPNKRRMVLFVAIEFFIVIVLLIRKILFLVRR